MLDWDLWIQTVWDVLQTDDEAVWALLSAAGGKMGSMVALIDGDLSTAEALAYARTLYELGFSFEARDVLTEVVRTAFGFFAAA